MMFGGGPTGQAGGAMGQGGGGGAGRQGPGVQGGGSQAAGTQGPGNQGATGQGPRAQGGGMTMADMLERLPTISLADLKVGDTIIMSTTQGNDPQRLTAISMVAFGPVAPSYIRSKTPPTFISR